MSIKPWEIVQLYQPGAWKAITDDGIWRACGVLHPGWINSFGHHEGNPQHAIVSHFPQQYAMTSSGNEPSFGQGLSSISNNLAQIITGLNGILTPPPKPPSPPKLQKPDTQVIDKISAEFVEDLNRPIVFPKLLPDYTMDPEELSAFERSYTSHLAWAYLMESSTSREFFTIAAAVATIIGAMGTIWSVVKDLFGAEKDMLKIPWGEFANVDGSLTHIYAEWYQGSAVRLRWTWGGTERDVYISKMSGQIITVLDDIRNVRQKQPKLPTVGLYSSKKSKSSIAHDLPFSPDLPWGYTGKEKLSICVPQAQELIASARGLTLEEHFSKPQEVIRTACPTHVQSALSYARNKIEYNMRVRERIASQLTFGSYARQRAETAITLGFQLLNIWLGSTPVPVKTALSIISTMAAIEIDLVRHIPIWEMAQEYGNATRQIEEAAELLRHIDINFPDCSSQ
jgi:hypothetical protein